MLTVDCREAVAATVPRREFTTGRDTALPATMPRREFTTGRLSGASPYSDHLPVLG